MNVASVFAGHELYFRQIHGRGLRERNCYTEVNMKQDELPEVQEETK